MNVRFIYFDLDDTLLDHRYAERAALADVRAAFADAFGGVSDETLRATYRALNGPLWRQYADGTIGKTDLQIGRFERLLASLDIRGLDAAAVSACYLDRYARHWRFTPGARTAFTRLAERYPVGVLTNGFAEVQEAKFDRFPVLRERAQALVVSEETGYMKPHPGVFAYAADAAQTPPGAILYVGDSYHSDVEGGLAAGWQVAWYARRGAAEATEAGCFAFEEWDALVEWLR